jgi:hypothetical protein
MTSPPLPIFSGRLIEEVPLEWGYGPVEKEKKRPRDLVDAIVLLRSGSVRVADIIEVYHAREVASLMVHTLLLYEMMPDAPLEGTALT